MAKKTQVTTQNQTTELPAWAQQYYTEILGRGLSLADEPYQAYGGPRVAGFRPEQEQAFEMTQRGIGGYQPYIDRARSLTESGARGVEGSALGAAQPYIDESLSFSELETAQPYLSRGISREALGLASPYLDRAGSGSALATASPFLAASGRTFPQAVDEYMSPYTSRVADVIAERSGRNLTENILPGVNRTFIGGGTFGGKRSQEFTRRAIRDANESALAEQAGVMERGYGQAADIFGADQSRLAGIGQSIGSLSGEDLRRMLDTGRSYADISGDIANRSLQAGQTAGTFTGAEADRYMRGAQISGDLAAGDLSRQQADRARQLQAGQQIAGLGEQWQRQYGTDVNAMAGIGNQRQALDQRSLDLGYEDFSRQRDEPWMRLDRLGNLVGGMNVPTMTNTTSTTTGSGASSTGQILGAVTSGIGLLNASGAFGNSGWLGNIFPKSSAPAVSASGSGGMAPSTPPFAPPYRKGGRATYRGLGWMKEAA